jgi:hypothetical protein
MKNATSARDWTREQLLEAVPDARTLPQIFLDDQHIGGFTDLSKSLYEDNMKVELDQVYTIKIANGDEIVSKITAEDDATFTP